MCSEQLEKNGPNFDPRALKDDGNAQYRLKNYFGAHVTYTLAIGLVRREDEGSQRLLAILYSNCAACSLAMNEYTRAAKDARKATLADASYAKGWVRLATAQQWLEQYHECIASWTHALSVIPTENISAEDLELQSITKANLEKAKELPTLRNKVEPVPNNSSAQILKR